MLNFTQLWMFYLSFGRILGKLDIGNDMVTLSAYLLFNIILVSVDHLPTFWISQYHNCKPHKMDTIIMRNLLSCSVGTYQKAKSAAPLCYFFLLSPLSLSLAADQKITPFLAAYGSIPVSTENHLLRQQQFLVWFNCEQPISPLSPPSRILCRSSILCF